MSSQKTESNQQSDRFIEKARELGCDEDEDRFNETLKKIAPTPAKEQPPEK